MKHVTMDHCLIRVMMVLGYDLSVLVVRKWLLRRLVGIVAVVIQQHGSMERYQRQ